jgi:hypothetical protein
MDPWSTSCPACNKPLAENVGQGSDYLYFEADGRYYHRKCLSIKLANVYVKADEE